MEEEINIKDLIIALWRKKIIIIIVTLIFFAIGLLLYGKKEDNNNSRNIIENDDVEISNIQTDFMFGRGTNEEFDGVTKSYKLTIDSGVITNLNTFAKSSNFLEGVLAEIDSKETIEDLQSNINIWGNGTSDIITLVVSSEKEEDAVKITNKILENLREKVYELYEIDNLILIDGPVEIEYEKVKEFEDKIKNDDVILEENVSDTVQEQGTGAKKKIVLISAIGFVLACGSIVVIEIFSSSVKSEEGLEKATNIKVLVKVPKTSLDITDKFELLRVKLNECKTILVTSSENSDGKSFISMNLSKSFARVGKKVLLTDAASIVSDKELEKDSKESKIKNLTVILSKENTNSEIEDSKIEDRLKSLENLYDIIIIDSSNVLDSANTLTVSKFVKTTILVSSERKTKIENIVKAKNNIEDIGGKVIGNVLNKTANK